MVVFHFQTHIFYYVSFARIYICYILLWLYFMRLRACEFIYTQSNRVHNMCIQSCCVCIVYLRRIAAKHLPHASNQTLGSYDFAVYAYAQSTTIYFNSLAAPENNSLKCIGENVIQWYKMFVRVYIPTTVLP